MPGGAASGLDPRNYRAGTEMSGKRLPTITRFGTTALRFGNALSAKSHALHYTSVACDLLISRSSINDAIPEKRLSHAEVQAK
jgi:hypothetical protein